MKWRARWYFIKPRKKNFSNLFSTWEKCVSFNCGNFCRTTLLAPSGLRIRKFTFAKILFARRESTQSCSVTSFPDICRRSHLHKCKNFIWNKFTVFILHCNFQVSCFDCVGGAVCLSRHLVSVCSICRRAYSRVAISIICPFRVIRQFRHTLVVCILHLGMQRICQARLCRFFIRLPSCSQLRVGVRSIANPTSVKRS